jgi:uncharacterized membrane protein
MDSTSVLIVAGALINLFGVIAVAFYHNASIANLIKTVEASNAFKTVEAVAEKIPIVAEIVQTVEKVVEPASIVLAVAK